MFGKLRVLHIVPLGVCSCHFPSFGISHFHRDVIFKVAAFSFSNIPWSNSHFGSKSNEKDNTSLSLKTRKGDGED